MQEQGAEVTRITWRGIEVEVSFERDWLHMSRHGLDTAHLQLRSITPAKASLPITDTGYRSHFTHAEVVDAYGGAVGFAMAWLDQAAEAEGWQQQEVAGRQLSLF